MNNFRDIEQLSAYLDGELGKAESKKLETRLANDPQFASALNDLRSARGILRKLPKRKAPRNFTLTRQMVGLKPPLPRGYKFVRFSTAFATVLLVISFAINFLSLGMGGAAAPAFESAPQYGGGYGGGGGDGEVQPGIGGGCQEPCGGAPMEEPAIAATEAPAAAAEELESAASDLAPQATMSISMDQSQPAAGGNTAQELGTSTPDTNAERVTAPTEGNVPSNKSGVNEVTESPQQNPVVNKPGIVINWKFILLGIIVLGLVIMFVMRQTATRKWR